MKTYKVYTLEKGIVETYNYGYISELTWHREDGPAIICYYDDGSIAKESYYIDNKMHMLDGPAYIVYDNNGNIQQAEYWINGKEYTKDQYNKELLKLKVQSL